MANCKLPNCDHSEKIKFIDALELGEHRYGLPETHPDRVVRLPPDFKKDAYIVAGGVACFTENVSGQAKQDILNATLLAQLAANKKHNRERSTEDWYKEYNIILGNMGFVIQDFQFEHYKARGSTLAMDEAVLEIIAAVATGNEVAVVEATLDAMRKMSNDDKKIVLFDTHGSHSSLGNFQVYPCVQAPDGEVSLSLGTFYFKGSAKDTNFLFFHWSSSRTKLYKGVQKAVLNSEVYARVRSAVSAKLGDNALSLLASIDI